MKTKTTVKTTIKRDERGCLVIEAACSQNFRLEQARARDGGDASGIKVPTLARLDSHLRQKFSDWSEEYLLGGEWVRVRSIAWEFADAETARERAAEIRRTVLAVARERSARARRFNEQGKRAAMRLSSEPESAL